MTAALLLSLAALLAFAAALWVRRHAGILRLVAAPNERSSHAIPTPLGGGVGIVLAGTACAAWLAGAQDARLWSIAGLALLLALVGLLDDIRHIPARLRLAVQLLACLALLPSIGVLPAIALPGLGPLPGWLGNVLLMLTAVWWINLFNFMDGIDGIAGGQAIFMLTSAAGLIAWGRPEAVGEPVWLLCLCVAAATSGFLVLNWPPASIFMGDVGSTWLAFVILAIALLTVQAGWLGHATWMVLAAAFVADTTLTLLVRAFRGARWHQPHRSHAYQRLSRLWRGDRKAGHRAATVLVLVIDVLWLAPLAWATVAFPQHSPIWLLAAYLPLAAGVLGLGAGRPDDA